MKNRIRRIIKNCKETGFEHIELRTTHAHGVEVTMGKEQRQTVRKRFEDAGLKISLASAFEYHYPDPARLRKGRPAAGQSRAADRQV
jgi:sugar phosphate isomerase/epimerase